MKFKIICLDSCYLMFLNQSILKRAMRNNDGDISHVWRNIKIQLRTHSCCENNLQKEKLQCDSNSLSPEFQLLCMFSFPVKLWGPASNNLINVNKLKEWSNPKVWARLRWKVLLSGRWRWCNPYTQNDMAALILT